MDSWLHIFFRASVLIWGKGHVISQPPKCKGRHRFSSLIRVDGRQHLFLFFTFFRKGPVGQGRAVESGTGAAPPHPPLTQMVHQVTPGTRTASWGCFGDRARRSRWRRGVPAPPGALAGCVCDPLALFGFCPPTSSI